jgi:hypothetical protein
MIPMMEQSFLLKDKKLEKVVRVSLEKYLYRSYGICYIVKEILKEVTNMKYLDMPT